MSGYDDAIVGAGIVGLACAYHLARRGRRVIVLERHPRAQGASVRNFGMLWPIGQTPGEMHQIALRSREHWLIVLPDARLWHEKTGSLHLAYRTDEAQVLHEFIHDVPGNGYSVEAWTPEMVRRNAPNVNPDGLVGAMWSPSEVCVDPREVVAGLPRYLTEKFGVEFRFGVTTLGYERPAVRTSGGVFEAENLYVCSGDEMQILYPETYATLGLIPCKLQMLRTAPTGNDYKLGPMLAAGLTLRHYKSFADCPSLPALKERVARETPEFDRCGIHVMASQNGAGELTLGDSHEYGAEIAPFDKDEIDRLVLNYLKTFLTPPNGKDFEISLRWHGVYVKHPEKSMILAHPEPGVTLVTGVGGAGMTLSFGVAELATGGPLSPVPFPPSTQRVPGEKGGTVDGDRSVTLDLHTHTFGPPFSPSEGGKGTGDRGPLLVVFDMAGTTVYDGEGAVARCLCDTLEAAGRPTTMPAAIALMGIPKPIAIRQLLTEQGISPEDALITTLHHDFIARMLHYYRHSPEVAPIPGAEETFAALRHAGIKVALDTGFSRDIADAVIKRLNWRDKIDASITSDEVENGRPHPDMILALMSRFGITDPARVAKVGDTPSDLQEGHAAHCGWVIGVTEGTHTAEQLAVYPHTHLIPSVAELEKVFA